MKKSRDAKDLIDSLIPMGMIFGCAIGVIFGMFFKPSFLVFIVSLGTGIGYLFGVIASGIYSKKGKSWFENMNTGIIIAGIGSVIIIGRKISELEKGK